MFKKECYDVLKQIVYSILVVLFISAFLFFTRIVGSQSYFSIFFVLFQVGLIFWAFFMGSSLFFAERGQRGMEYLLSFPLSRLGLVGIKILPRFAAVLIFYLVYIILYVSGGEDSSILSLLSFTVIYFAFYLISLSLVACSENFLVLFIISSLSLLAYLGLMYSVLWLGTIARGMADYELEISSFFTGEIEPFMTRLIILFFFCLLLPPLISLGLSFRKFDLRPSRIYNKRFLNFFAPLFILGLCLSFVFSYYGIDTGYASYYLTQDHKLIESNEYSGVKVYDGKKSHKVKGKHYFFWSFFEDSEFVYGESWEKVIRLNTSDYSMETLYEASPEMYVLWSKMVKSGQKIAFFERKRDYSDLQLILLDELSKKVTRIPFDRESLAKYYNPIIFGADEADGKKFWLICSWSRYESPVLRIWEDGKIEVIAKSERWPLYINRMLITGTKEELIFSKEKEGQFVPVRKASNKEGYNFGYMYRPANLDNQPLKEIYGWNWKEKERTYARLDLETYEISKLFELRIERGFLTFFPPDNCYYVEMDTAGATLKIYKLEHGKTRLIKSFTNFAVSFSSMLAKENRFDIFKGGIILQRGKKVKAYAFPDLKEIKFKKLR